MISSLFLNALLLVGAAATRYEQYILAPNSRDLFPASVYEVNGTVQNADSLCQPSGGAATFEGWSSVAYDYGKNIGGVVSLTVSQASDDQQYVGVAFSESSLWVSGNWSDATADAGNDEILWWSITGPGTYTLEEKYVRGGFKYLTLVHNTTGTVVVSQVSTRFSAVPHYAEDQLRNYSGWFNSNGKISAAWNINSDYADFRLPDELINRIWYAGAYTAQLCTIDPHFGNSLNFINIINSNQTIDGSVPWWSNTTIANSSSVLADGAKRDRLVWPGDMVTSWPSQLVSTNDKVTVTNSLDSLFQRQNTSNGIMPYAGYPFPLIYSATYHLHSLIGAAEIYVYDGDIEWIRGKW